MASSKPARRAVLLVTVDRAGGVPLIRITDRTDASRSIGGESRTTDPAVALAQIDEWLHAVVRALDD